LPVEQAINDDEKSIGVIETRIAPAVRYDNARRIVVKGDNPDKERGV
jgi:hypothetical protein